MSTFTDDRGIGEAVRVRIPFSRSLRRIGRVAIRCALAGLLLAGAGCRTSDVTVRRALPVVDTLRVELTQRVASFEHATAMDLSPSMMLYVADAGADIIYHFQISPRMENRPGSMTDARQRGASGFSMVPSGIIGGSGTEPGLFQEPVSVDASAALFVNIADAGNGRIQRFSSGGALVEVIPVPQEPGTDAHIQSGFRYDQPAIDDSETVTRPTGVESTSSNDIIVIESGTRQILMTDDRRRGWISLGDAQPRVIHPVDVEFMRSRIVVADAGSDRLFVYDRLGSLIEVIETVGNSPLAAIIPTPSGSAILAGNELFHFPNSDPDSDVAPEEPASTWIGVLGQRPVLIRIETDERISDVRFVGSRLLVLTNQSLFVVSANEIAP